jgi:predicted short-subunit dehydrogenase-like oxidoreductase (DUF2520 family)
MQRFLIIGFGKLGSSLARFLKDDVHAVVRVADPKPFDSSFKIVADQAEYSSALSKDIVNTASFIFICTSDDQIPFVARQLQSFNLKNKFVVHTSGATGTGPLKGLRRQGALVGSFHPLQTFNEMLLPAQHWYGIYATFQGDATILDALKSLFEPVGIKIVPVNSKQKQAVHLAAAVAANFQVALYSWADEILKQAGLQTVSAGELFGPLAGQVAKNFAQKPLGQILSGPLQRGDLQTIGRHVQYLKDAGDQEGLGLYRMLARKLLQNADFPIKDREQLWKFLKGREK